MLGITPWSWNLAAARLFPILFILGFSEAEFVDKGRVTSLNGISYYVGGISIAKLSGISLNTLEEVFPEQDLFPLTVIHVGGGTFGADELNATISNFTSQDDVFQEDFLQAIYLNNTLSAPSAVHVADCVSFSQEYHRTKLFTVPNANTSSATSATLSGGIPNGPYFVSITGNVFKAHRLYPDHNLAFIQAAISDENGGFLALPGTTEDVMAKNVAVPSRLYYTPSASKPLAGLRMGVKDIFHVKGLRTSGGSRSYYYLYGPQNITAPSVQRLIDQGAVFVGKTGTVQFANGDRPTADWVDLHCPFNARGDGYQVPSGSSSGSGAAIGAYDWLDIAVGSDTGGSMRGPAQLNGVFGNRPSTGAISLDHVIPLTPHLDTAGVFARSGTVWSAVTRAWYDENSTASFPAYPKNIYVSTELPDETTPAATDLFNTFLDQLSTVLHANRTAVNISQHWLTTHPTNTTSNLPSMLNQTYAILTSVDQFALLGAPLFAAYAAAHAGRLPFINPGPLARWTWGQTHGTPTTYAAAARNMSTFRGWWETAGFGRRDAAACSAGVYAYLGAAGAPSYRDEYFSARSTPPLGFADWAVAGYAGAPEVVVPLGEAPYRSRVSGREEWLPVAANLLVARGCDGMLARLVEELEARAVLRPVEAGARLYR
ncbi:putative glutamyl-tRNA subunit a protein [Neofusicoccum parvum]|uniref:Glutamyl-tRNA subunit a protein n=1 Tax=Neofusicoccum parvum TaxID=310453 RepID=A0ACB5S409_9PEZI|nr:putative glutamyl-tRNA subunit a protein [Neofusicoccum parvum]